MNTEPNPTNPFASPGVAPSPLINENGVNLEQYSMVRIGFQLIYYSIAVIAIAVILFAVFGIFGAQTIAPGVTANSTLFFLPLICFALAVIVAAIAMFVGFCMCAACPKEDERTRAFITIGAFLLSIAIGIVGEFLPLEANMAMTWIGQFLSIVSTIAFCLLVKRIGKNVFSESMQKQARKAISWYGYLIAVSLIGVAVIVVSATAMGTVGRGISGGSEIILAIFAVAMVVLGLGTFFQFLNMVRVGIVELKPRTKASK